MSIRQIFLDTETTGLDPQKGHRLIEVAAVELIDRRFTGNHFHYYVNPERAVDKEAQQVHGISTEFLKDKPLFANIAKELWAYLGGAELIIHNAPFDLGFLNHEFQQLGENFIKVEEYCSILDTLVMARQKHRGAKNNLDALCKRYEIDISERTLHGALLDAQLLGKVYLAMTSGQMDLLGALQESAKESFNSLTTKVQTMDSTLSVLEKPQKIIRATAEELQIYKAYREKLGLPELPM